MCLKVFHFSKPSVSNLCLTHVHVIGHLASITIVHWVQQKLGAHNYPLPWSSFIIHSCRVLITSRVIHHNTCPVFHKTLYPYPRKVSLARNLCFVSLANFTPKTCHVILIAPKLSKHLLIIIILLLPLFKSSIGDLLLLHNLVRYICSMCSIIYSMHIYM